MKAYPEETRLEAQRLRANGWSYRRIARHLGVPMGTARRWVNPDHTERERAKARRRKATYRGRCVDCGAETSYSGTGTQPSERCAPCRIAYQHDQKVWTREAIIAAIQAWAAEHGRPPAARDWRRGTPGIHPPTSVVYQSSTNGAPFRYWADAIEAAGFPRPRVGHYDRARLAA